MWKKLWTKIKENWIALTALLASVFTFIFCKHRTKGLGANQQLCTDIREITSSVKSDIEDSRDEIGTVRTGIDELTEQAKSVADIIRKYGSGDSDTN